MEKIVAAQARLLNRVFICKRCGSKIRTDIGKVLEGKAKCRKCNSRALRPKSKKK